MRRLGWIFFVIASYLLALVAPTACTTTLVPPAKVNEPAPVFLLDHGRTPSLVLPTDDGNLAMYVYGDWDWYALDKTNFFTGVAALLWPTQGGLGRSIMPGPPTLERLHEAHGGIEYAYPIIVERNRVRALQKRLDALFEQGRDHMVERPGSDLQFVPHPQKYTYFSNSNEMTAKWLEELGVEARGWAMASKWRVESAAQAQGETHGKGDS